MKEGYKSEDFELANRAFDLFSLAEREAALTKFAGLRYSSVRDRFNEAVYLVIVDQKPPTREASAKERA